MANYSIVADTTFTPYTFDQMVKPFEMYGNYYKEQEETLSKLEEEAAEWGKKANEITDPVAAKTYRDYETALKKQAARMSREGMSLGLRQDIRKLRTRYAKDINPIKDAYAWKIAQIQSQAEGKSKGIVYAGDAATTSLDDYVLNPTLIYGAADSNVGYSRVANAAQTIAKGLADAKITGNLDAYTEKILIKSGYDVSDVSNAITQATSDLQGIINGSTSIDSPAGSIVKELLHNEAEASGINTWDNTKAQQEYMSKIAPALYNLIGPASVSPVDNYGARADKQLANQLTTIAAQGEETRKNIDHQYTSIAHNRGASGKSSSSKKSKAYVPKGLSVYKDGKSTQYKSWDDTDIASNGLAGTDIFFTKRADGSIYYINSSGAELAHWNPKKPDEIQYKVPNSKTYKVHHGGAEFEDGIFKGYLNSDVLNLSKELSVRPGSENQRQIKIGYNGDGIYLNTEDSPTEVTKDVDNSGVNLSEELSDIYNM